MGIEGLNDAPGGALGVIGAGIAAIGAGFFAFRTAIRRDTIGAANTQAEVEILDRLSDELTKANARADLAEARATEASRELNALLREMGELRARMAELTVEVRMLKERLPTSLSADISDYISARRDEKG